MRCLIEDWILGSKRNRREGERGGAGAIQLVKWVWMFYRCVLVWCWIYGKSEAYRDVGVGNMDELVGKVRKAEWVGERPWGFVLLPNS